MFTRIYLLFFRIYPLCMWFAGLFISNKVMIWFPDLIFSRISKYIPIFDFNCWLYESNLMSFWNISSLPYVFSHNMETNLCPLIWTNMLIVSINPEFYISKKSKIYFNFEMFLNIETFQRNCSFHLIIVKICPLFVMNITDGFVGSHLTVEQYLIYFLQLNFFRIRWNWLFFFCAFIKYPIILSFQTDFFESQISSQSIPSNTPFTSRRLNLADSHLSTIRPHFQHLLKKYLSAWLWNLYIMSSISSFSMPRRSPYFDLDYSSESDSELQSTWNVQKDQLYDISQNISTIQSKWEDITTSESWNWRSYLAIKSHSCTFWSLFFPPSWCNTEIIIPL